jgi:ParB family chromosome partitioning protein
MGEGDKKLGRGLDFLISPKGSLTTEDEVVSIPVERIRPNRQQPRRDFQPEPLADLEESIRKHGLLQPIVVRKTEDGYEIVAGERRWRAYQKLGHSGIPAIVRDVPEGKLLEYALIENIQREDLNAIEEAQAYQRLSEEFRMSQEAIAAAVGKDRATIANYIRLLRLPVEVRNELASGVLSMGHARALLSLADESAQRRVAREVVSRGLSVRETEALVRRESTPAVPPPPRKIDPNTRAAEDRLKLALGTRVRIVRKGTTGRIEIDFGSEDELQRLYEQLTGK